MNDKIKQPFGLTDFLVNHPTAEGFCPHSRTAARFLLLRKTLFPLRFSPTRRRFICTSALRFLRQAHSISQQGFSASRIYPLLSHYGRVSRRVVNRAGRHFNDGIQIDADMVSGTVPDVTKEANDRDVRYTLKVAHRHHFLQLLRIGRLDLYLAFRTNEPPVFISWMIKRDARTRLYGTYRELRGDNLYGPLNVSVNDFVVSTLQLGQGPTRQARSLWSFERTMYEAGYDIKTFFQHWFKDIFLGPPRQIAYVGALF